MNHEPLPQYYYTTSQSKIIMISSSQSSLHRPFQSNSNNTRAQNEKPGRTILQLLRTRDKLILRIRQTSTSSSSIGTKRDESPNVTAVDSIVDESNDNATNGYSIHENELHQVETELLSQLSSLDSSIRRCGGLFANNVDRATAYYNCAADRSSLNNNNNTLAATTSTAVDHNNTDGSSSSSKNRKRKKGGGGSNNISGSGGGGAGSLSASSYGIYLDSSTSSYNSSMGGGGGGDGGGGGEKKRDLDEGLILTGICKILGVHVGRRKKLVVEGEEDNHVGSVGVDRANDDGNIPSSYSYPSCYGFSISCSALSILSSICDHAIHGNTACASIEGDMIGSIGTHLLDALHENISLCNVQLMQEEGAMVLHTLLGSLKACASVVCLLETRLSRADKTMQNLKEIAWMVLNNMPTTCSAYDNNINMTGGSTHDKLPLQDAVRNATTALLASLALAGNSEGIPPSKLWSQSVSDAILLLQWAIHDFFPMPNVTSSTGGEGSSHQKQKQRQYPNLWSDHVHWMTLAKDASSQGGDELDLGNDTTSSNHRSRALLSRIQCLTRFIVSLLRMEGYPLHRLPNNMPSLVIHLPLDSLLDVSEILLSFPLAAEARHRSTKSRLRDTPVADGLLSPNTAMEIAPDVRLCGHELLNTVVESCRGGSGVRGRARRVVNMAAATLQSSCSSILVSVVDGSLRGGGGGVSDGSSRLSKNGSWLRGSIPLRIEAIRTFHVIAVSLGSGIMSSTGTSKSISRALVLLGGSLLEQIQDCGSNAHQQSGVIGIDDEWGTLGELAKLVETASNTLAACIAAFGGLIPNNVRGTLDSIIQTCFSNLYSSGNSSILAYSHVKRAILQLGMNCMCVPWRDGARSTISIIVRTVSEMLRNDPDVSVASVALSTLCVLDAFTTPRAPPLLVPIRDSIDGSGNHSISLTASSLIVGMNDTKLEMQSTKLAAEERRVTKSERKTSKITKKEADNSETHVHSSLNEEIVESGADLVRDAVEGLVPDAVGGIMGDASADTMMDIEGQHDAIAAAAAFEHEPKNEAVVGTQMSESRSELQSSAKYENTDAIDSKQTTENSDDEASDDSMEDFPAIVDEGPDDEDRLNN